MFDVSEADEVERR